MQVPTDYVERVYAGVLGKIIGVYLGRPIEGWTYERISAELGEVRYYVHDRADLPLHNRTLVVTDDDIAGTFTFLRALRDYAVQGSAAHAPSAAQIGQTWLNYIIEGRTILWWGGYGNSTEHTAYLNLKRGVLAPDSGSAARNGPVIAAQIGAQIFIDGWAMVAPGDPELAADLARRAAGVSHDGEAIYAAQVIAAMEAQAFVERDGNSLLDVALSLIPADAGIARLINDLREWHVRDGDWRRTRARIAAEYGYDRYGGNCHVVPNHALVILALLYGGDDFQHALHIVTSCGWDTDCNAGNVGCLLGIKNGLAGIDAGPDWRGPVADRLYLSTADGGRAITDAATEAYHIINSGRALAGMPPLAPKNGARFHFELPGSVQGWQPGPSSPPATPHTDHPSLLLENVVGHSQPGARSLALRYRFPTADAVVRAATPTFIPPEALDMPGYPLLAAPTLYPGQLVQARVEADAANDAPLVCGLYIEVYGAHDALTRIHGPAATLPPGIAHNFTWRIAETDGAPIAAIGLELRGEEASRGSLYLDMLGWDGAPDVLLARPAHGGTLWRRAWVDGVDQWDDVWPEAYRLVQNTGTGLIMQGAREWRDYVVEATLTPQLATAAGIGARVQGMRRYYALLLCRDGVARLMKACDGDTLLTATPFAWQFGTPHVLRMRVAGDLLQGWIDGQLLLEARDPERPLDGGGVALLITEGCVSCDAVRVQIANCKL